MSKWQLIETAPEDGTKVMLWRDGYIYQGAKQLFNDFKSRGDGSAYIIGQHREWVYHTYDAEWPFSPTHWQPLPEPPND